MAIDITTSTVRHKKIIESLIILTIIGLSLLLLVDSYGNSATSEKIIGINSAHLIVWVLAIVGIARATLSVHIPSRLSQLFGLAAALLAPAVAIITAIAYLADDNVLYSTTRIQIEELGLLTIFLAAVALLGRSKKWWQKNFDRFVILLPFAALLFFSLARLWPFNFFMEMVKEDNAIENAQALILLVGSGAAVWLARGFWQQNKRWWFATYIFFAIGLFFAGGEEISWGQRILGIETPQAWADRNLQGETTLHNLPEIQRYMHWSYLILTLFGFLGRPLLRTLQPFTQTIDRHNIHSYLPDSRFLFYFLPPFFFFFGNIIISWGVWHEWAEVMELYIYVGVVAWLLWLGASKLSEQSRVWKIKLPKIAREW